MPVFSFVPSVLIIYSEVMMTSFLFPLGYCCYHAHCGAIMALFFFQLPTQAQGSNTSQGNGTVQVSGSAQVIICSVSLFRFL